jgi:hypothetical protein
MGESSLSSSVYSLAEVFHFYLSHASHSPWLEAVHLSYYYWIHLVSSLDMRQPFW